MAVFVSSSSKDRAFVRRSTAELERHSIEVWVDERELRAGESLTSISNAIAEAEFLVVVVSKAAANSFWVQQEIDLADDADVPVLPLLVEDVPPARAPTLGETAHVDFRRPAEYRRAAHRLVYRSQGMAAGGRFLHAKEAVLLVRRERAPA
ncbi:toll/interleukin-1 receptor domain-containing protein [Lentzea sp. NEAU-D13]|uniref:Toll/interleukin-1 receptor domain-containing protein n=1 Tax=Lentzea alba TaxID=2714351 RepID=A0A7C9RXG3_9PSEU|nr:toll/interleukin-1 receptor domain-containing protein [Lentzea alba]NGY65327.1 toll/interleukin-1 receptor domain-containing protein [Lentzea alba]